MDNICVWAIAIDQSCRVCVCASLRYAGRRMQDKFVLKSSTDQMANWPQGWRILKFEDDLAGVRTG